VSVIKEIVPDISTWPEFSEEKQLNFNGYYIARKGESVLIDPPELDGAGLNELSALILKNSDCPLKAIYLTNVHHDRTSRFLKDKFSIPIYIHEKDKDLLEFSPDETFADGDSGPCGLKVIHISDQKSPGESAFLFAEIKTMIVGDALIGKIPGKLNLLPAEKYSDIHQAKESLWILLESDFDTLLVGDGHSILKDAKVIASEFLQS
jgi:glyoxylase-like metal-dependent hydrolase (beta-lactamase superfamily II)